MTKLPADCTTKEDVRTELDRIDQAKSDWKAMRFPPVPGETEFIPLPDY